MNLTHIHLLINHLPVFGSMLGAVVMIYALSTRSIQTKIAAYLLFVISSIGAVITYLTGEAAEETVENIQGISKNLLDQHEDFAGVALAALIILGVFSLGGIYMSLNRLAIARTFSMVTLFIAMLSFGIIGYAGYLGGQICHTEVSGNVVTPDGAGNIGEQEN